MRRIGFGGILALVCLIYSACATVPQAVRIHLPEPPLPACLVEEAPQDRQAVGSLEFAPSWVEQLKTMGSPREVVMGALMCAGETAKSLREALSTIRLNNRAGIATR